MAKGSKSSKGQPGRRTLNPPNAPRRKASAHDIPAAEVPGGSGQDRDVGQFTGAGQPPQQKR
jgi:hypothetical protein